MNVSILRSADLQWPTVTWRSLRWYQRVGVVAVAPAAFTVAAACYVTVAVVVAAFWAYVGIGTVVLVPIVLLVSKALSAIGAFVMVGRELVVRSYLHCRGAATPQPVI